MKHLMSGNEATARGVYESGIKVCSAYPGTPSTEILENLPSTARTCTAKWAPNEKVATEVAYGVCGRLPFLLHHEDGGPTWPPTPCSPPATWASTAPTWSSPPTIPPLLPERAGQPSLRPRRQDRHGEAQPRPGVQGLRPPGREISEEFDTPVCTAPPPASVTARAWWSSASVWSTWPPPMPATPVSTSAPPPTPT